MIEASIIHVPRSGGISLMHAIAEMLGWDYVLGVHGRDQIDKPQNVYIRPEYRVAIGHFGFGWFPEAKKYIVLRNPVERVLSLYAYATVHAHHAPWWLEEKPKTLSEFLQHCPTANNGLTRQLLDLPTRGPVDKISNDLGFGLAKQRLKECNVYSFENLSGLMCGLAKQFGTNPYMPDRLNSVSKPSYGWEDIEMIARHNELDIKLFCGWEL